MRFERITTKWDRETQGMTTDAKIDYYRVQARFYNGRSEKGWKWVMVFLGIALAAEIVALVSMVVGMMMH